MKLILLFLILFSTFNGQTRKEIDLSKYFVGYDASFVMLDINENEYVKYNDKQLDERLSPCSTFKIPNSLIGLETGVIADTGFVIRWDGIKHPNENWNRDHSLSSAFPNSVVPYYQELARRVGKEKMTSYINKIHYGNSDLSGQIDRFWLMSSLKISANEQLDFLKRLYRNELPFSERSIKIVKDLMIYRKTNKGVLRGKTGSGSETDKKEFIGWYVGYLSTGENTYIFAANIKSHKQGASGMKLRGILISIFEDMQLL